MPGRPPALSPPAAMQRPGGSGGGGGGVKGTPGAAAAGVGVHMGGATLGGDEGGGTGEEDASWQAQLAERKAQLLQQQEQQLQQGQGQGEGNGQRAHQGHALQQQLQELQQQLQQQSQQPQQQSQQPQQRHRGARPGARMSAMGFVLNRLRREAEAQGPEGAGQGAALGGQALG